MRKLILILLLFWMSTPTQAQNDSLNFSKKSKNRYGIWVLPSAAKNIYGLAIGPIGSEAICNMPYTKNSHGINLQLLGQGFLQVFYINKNNLLNTNKLTDTLSVDSSVVMLPKRVVHNGLLLSPFGTFSDQINGINLSLFMSMGGKVNGLSINLFWNLYHEINGLAIVLANSNYSTKGVQIGLINKSTKLTGVQIGLWNKTGKRSLPLLNWNFKN